MKKASGQLFTRFFFEVEAYNLNYHLSQIHLYLAKSLLN